MYEFGIPPVVAGFREPNGRARKDSWRGAAGSVDVSTVSRSICGCNDTPDSELGRRRNSPEVIEFYFPDSVFEMFYISKSPKDFSP